MGREFLVFFFVNFREVHGERLRTLTLALSQRVREKFAFSANPRNISELKGSAACQHGGDMLVKRQVLTPRYQ